MIFEIPQRLKDGSDTKAPYFACLEVEALLEKKYNIDILPVGDNYGVRIAYSDGDMHVVGVSVDLFDCGIPEEQNSEVVAILQEHGYKPIPEADLPIIDDSD